MGQLRTRRTTLLLPGALLVLLAGGAIVTHQVGETHQADAALERAGTAVKTEVQRFRRHHADYPDELRLRTDAVQMSGASGTETNTIDAGAGVRLVWYSDQPDPRLGTSSQEQGSGYSFCLSMAGRHWRLNATEDAVATAGPPEGDCPRHPSGDARSPHSRRALVANHGPTLAGFRCWNV